MSDEQKLRRRRTAFVAGTAGLLIGPVFAAGRGLGLPPPAAGAVVVVLAILGLVLLPKRVPDEIPNAFGPGRWRFVVWCIVSVLTTVLVTRLGVFMGEPEMTDLSTLPSSKFMTEHSCATAYFEAARVAATDTNPYDPAFAHVDGHLEGADEEWRKLDGFQVDPYEYPPSFLVVPRIAYAVSKSFLTHRAVWFLADVLIAMLAVTAIARLLGAERGARFILLAPGLLLPLNIRLTLQIGNFQIAAIGLSIIAMGAFVRGRTAGGGALLGFTTVSKLFPALLVLQLMVRKRWRDVAWTAGAGIAFTVLAYVGFGPHIFEEFLSYHLPRLSSGEAFSFLRIPQAAVINQSVFGIVIKGMHMGIPGFDFPLAAKVAWVYNLFVIGMAVFLARRLREDISIRVVLAVLGLGALRSPFVPQDYGPIIPQLLLLTFIAAGGQTRGRLIASIVGFMVVSIGIPPEAVQPNTLVPMMVVSSVPQIVGYIVIAMTIIDELRKSKAAAAAAPAAA